jgi:hypothetical protein
MTPLERWWLQGARRAIRLAIVKVEYGDWHAAVSWVQSVVNAPLVTSNTSEVIDLLTSSAVADPKLFISNAAMRAAFSRRLEETKTLIGNLLVATTDP